MVLFSLGLQRQYWVKSIEIYFVERKWQVGKIFEEKLNEKRRQFCQQNQVKKK